MTCEIRKAADCKRTWSIEERLANETRTKNGGRVICSRCSIATKRSGRTNPNARYALDDAFMDGIDSEVKAYLLGWIASDGSIAKNTISIYVHRRDRVTLEALRDLLCRELRIVSKGDLLGFAINSNQIVAAVCRHLDISPGKKSSTVGFPTLATAELTWAFVRGFFDGDGSISSLDASLRRAERRGGWPTPRCSITSNSVRMLDGIAAFTKVPGTRSRDQLQWQGAGALDLLGRLYRGATIRLTRKHDLYLDWCVWTPAIRTHTPAHPLFRWARTHPEASAPAKAAPSDSGFDLTLIARAHTHGSVEFFRTGIKVQPAFGWYFDLVPRSSISKTGYMLANSVGVIDRGYTGEILVPLVKVDPNARDLALPARLVQIIPRTIIAAELVEVSDFDETLRGAGGFGSSG